MKLRSVQYEACFNLGGYENERIRLEVILEQGDVYEAEEAVDTMRQQALRMASPNATKINNEIWEAQRKLRKLNEQIVERTEQWNKIAVFLRAQGVNADAEDLPSVTNLLAPADESVVEGEFDPDDDSIAF